LKVAESLPAGHDPPLDTVSPALLQLAALLGRVAAREVWVGSTEQRCNEPQGIEGNEVP
jgi:hypothetical protein